MIFTADEAFKPVREHNCLNFFAFDVLSRFRSLSISSIPAMKQTNAFETALSPPVLVAPEAGLAEISDPNNRKNINFMAYKMMGEK